MKLIVITLTFSIFSGATALILLREQDKTQHEQEENLPGWVKSVLGRRSSKVGIAVPGSSEPNVVPKQGGLGVACPKGQHLCPDLTCSPSCGSKKHKHHKSKNAVVPMSNFPDAGDPNAVVPFEAPPPSGGFSSLEGLKRSPLKGRRTRSFDIIVGGAKGGDTWETALIKIADGAIDPSHKVEWISFAQKFLRLMANKVSHLDDISGTYPKHSDEVEEMEKNWMSPCDKPLKVPADQRIKDRCAFDAYVLDGMGETPPAFKQIKPSKTNPSFVEYTFLLEETFRKSQAARPLEGRLLWSGNQGKDLVTSVRDEKNTRCATAIELGGSVPDWCRTTIAVPDRCNGKAECEKVIKYLTMDDTAIGALFSISEAITCPMGACMFSYLKSQKFIVDPFESYTLDNICGWRGYPCIIEQKGDKPSKSFSERCDVFYEDSGTPKDAGMQGYYGLPERKMGAANCWGPASTEYMAAYMDTCDAMGKYTGSDGGEFVADMPKAPFVWVVDAKRSSRMAGWSKLTELEKMNWLAGKAAMRAEITQFYDSFIDKSVDPPAVPPKLTIRIISFGADYYPPTPGYGDSPAEEVKVLVEKILLDPTFARNPLPGKFVFATDKTPKKTKINWEVEDADPLSPGLREQQHFADSCGQVEMVRADTVDKEKVRVVKPAWGDW